MTDVSPQIINNFFLAAETGDLNAMAATLAEYPDAVNWVRPLPEGANPFSKNETALLAASAENKTDAMRLLLDHGADVNAKNGRGWTPLHFAAWRGNDDGVRLLLSRNANTSVETENQYTAAANADLGGHHDLAKEIRNAFNTYAMKFMRDGLPETVSAPETATWKKRPKTGP